MEKKDEEEGKEFLKTTSRKKVSRQEIGLCWFLPTALGVVLYAVGLA